MAAPKFKTRKGAASGEPSMLWIGKSGRYYRNIVHAKIDNPANAINANAINANGKSTASVKQAATNNLFFIVIAVLAILVLIRLIK